MSAYAEYLHANTEEEAREALRNIAWECRGEDDYEKNHADRWNEEEEDKKNADTD